MAAGAAMKGENRSKGKKTFPFNLRHKYLILQGIQRNS